MAAALTIAIAAAFAAGIAWQRRAVGTAAHEQTAAGVESIYHCPMHPTVTSPKPGSCPICGMKLVLRRGSTAADPSTQPAGRDAALPAGVAEIALSQTQRVMANVRTARVVASPALTSVVATGRVQLDERRAAQATAAVAGRVESLAVAAGAPVARGAAVATLWSPELYASQQEYLLAIRARREGADRPLGTELAASARRRLLLLGMPAGEIDALAARGSASRTFTVRAPRAGIVTRTAVVAQQYVAAGEPLVEIADISTVWVEADVAERDLARIAPGQRATVRAAGGAADLPARVASVGAELAGESRTGRVRIELPNAGLAVRPGMSVTVTLEGAPGPLAPTVPASAIVDRGLHKFVWIEVAPGRYAPRQVTAGAASGGVVQIQHGLREGDTVVVEGAFLLDSEAQLRGADPGAAASAAAGGAHDGMVH